MIRVMQFSGALLAISLCGLGLRPSWAGSTGDDFSSESGLWTSGEVANAGNFTVAGGTLNFVTSGSLTSYDVAERVWMGSALTYTEPWSFRVDLTIADFPSSQNASAGMFLENADGSGDLVRLAYFGGESDRRLYSDALVDGLTTASGQAFSASTTVALQLTFDPDSKMVTAAYDTDAGSGGYHFVPLFDVEVDSSPNDWGMTETGEFRILLRAHSDNLALTEGLVSFDNFAAVPEPSTLAATSFWFTLLVAWRLRRRLRRAA